MTKKLIWISLISVAALITVTIPSAQGGYYSYNTSWTMTCSGVAGLNVLGQLKLTTKQGVVLKSPAAGCSSSSGTTSTDISTPIDPVNTPAAPSSWTWTSPGCLNIHNKPVITGKFGQSVPYNCFSTVPDPNGFYPLLASGSIMVSKPVGQY